MQRKNISLTCYPKAELMRLETQLGGILLTNLAGEHCEFCSLNKFLSLQRENPGIFGKFVTFITVFGTGSNRSRFPLLYVMKR